MHRSKRQRTWLRRSIEMAIRLFSTKHTRDTAAPQTYWQHGCVAISKSAHLIWLGLAGVIHGFLPEIKGLQFYTSTGILRAAHYLMMCGRHDREIERIFGPNFMETVRLERPRKTAVDIMYRDTYRERKMLREFAK
jgi:hypothetical protein